MLLMALRKEPDRRYPSVRDFAEDVERYLHQQPVRARPQSAAYRIRKFARRNWLPLTAAGLLTGSILTGFFFTNRERLRAEQRFGEVRQLANPFLFDFEGKIHDLPGATPAREMVVATALEYLNRLQKDAKGDSGLMLEIAEAYQKTAALQGSPAGAGLGHFREALATYAKARATLVSLDPDPAGTMKVRLKLAECLLRVTQLDTHIRDYRKAQEDSDALTKVVDSLSTPDSDSAEVRDLRMRTLAERGAILIGLEKSSEALAPLAEASRMAEKLAKSGDPDARYALIIRQTLLSDALIKDGQLEEALRVQKMQWASISELLRQNPNSHSYRRALLVSFVLLGNLEGAIDRPSFGRRQEAVVDYEQARAIARQLFDADPRNDLARQDYALCTGKIADVVALSDPRRSIALSDEAFALLEKGVSSDDHERNIVGYYTSVCHPLMALQRNAEAESQIDKGIAMLQRLLAATPQSLGMQSQLATAYRYLGDVRHQRRDWKAAATNYERALGMQEPAIRTRPGNLVMQYELAELYDSLAGNAGLSRKRCRPGLRRRIEGIHRPVLQHAEREATPFVCRPGIDRVRLRRRQAARCLATTRSGYGGPWAQGTIGPGCRFRAGT